MVRPVACAAALEAVAPRTRATIHATAVRRFRTLVITFNAP
jgi:hypothetical protein